MPAFPNASALVLWPIQYVALAIVIIMMAGMLTFSLCYVYFRKRSERKQERWRAVSDLLISRAIFFDEEDDSPEDQLKVAIARGKKLVRNRHFRNLLLKETLNAKKNISGKASDNLRNLYQQLGLEKRAMRRINSRRWYIKAKAVQELSLLEIEEALPKIYRCADDANEHVRMEAQAALVQLKGFEGLAFLDFATYPISGWQQVKLLQLLCHRAPCDLRMDHWLLSQNSSVVVFALKLARNYQRFDLHDEIVACLDHADTPVRLEAIACLKEIYTDETSDELISRFLAGDLSHRIAMLRTLRTIAAEKHLLFLEDLLDDQDDEIKIQAARALAGCGIEGLTCLELSADKNDVLKEIFLHVKGEIAA